MFRPTYNLWRRAAEGLLVLLVFCVPLGTRLMGPPGLVAGHAVEWGTVSLFATQILAGLFLAAVAFARPRFPAPAALLAAPLVVIIVISALASGHPSLSWLSAGWWLLLAVFVWLAVLALRPDVTGLAKVFVASTALQAVIGLQQFFSQAVTAAKWLGMAAQRPGLAGASVVETGGERWLRAYGTLPHPNVLGIFCVVGLVLAVALAARTAGWRRVGWSLVAFFVTAGLIISFSRSAWLAAAVGLTVLILASAERGRALWRFGPPLLLVAAAVAVAAVLLPGLFSARLTATGRLESASVTQRLGSLADGRALVAAHPFLGAGPGQAVAALAVLQPGRGWWLYEPPHFLPLTIAAEVGLPGLLAWLLLLVGIARFLWRHAWLSDRPLEAVVAPAWPVAFLAALTAGCFDHYFWTLWPAALLFWLVLGFAVVVTVE